MTETRAQAVAQPIQSRGERVRESLSIFRVRGYPFLLGSNASGFAGFQVRNMAQGWLVLALTDSAFAVGLVNAVPQFVLLLLSPFGGTLADRYDRRTVVIRSRMAVAVLSFVTAYLVASNRIEVWQLVVLGALVGAGFAVGNSSSQTLVFDLVGRQRLLSAISLNTMISNLASVIGPALGGVLVASVGIGGAFWLLAGIYAFSFLALLGMPGTAGKKEEKSLASAWQETVAGLRYAFRTPGLNWMMVLMMSILFWGAMQPVIPVYARDILGVGAEGFGFIFGTWAAGALVTSVAIFVIGTVRRKMMWVLVSVLVYAAATIGFAYSTNYALSLFFIFVTGMAAAVWITLMFTVLQTVVEDSMRGRVIGVSQSLVMLLGFGYLLGGALTELVSASTALVASALAWAAVTAIAYARSRELRAFN